MDDFKDFFKDLRDRVSNPFIISFIISWLITNWPITIALIYYDEAAIKADGFRSLYQLIRFHSSVIDLLAKPFIWASIFTVGFPYVKSLIKLHNATIKAQNESDILKRTKQNSVSLTKYVEMLDETGKAQKELADLIASQSTIKSENIKLQGEINELKITVLEQDDAMVKLTEELKKSSGDNSKNKTLKSQLLEAEHLKRALENELISLKRENAALRIKPMGLDNH